jgi:hypothetical protein
MTFSFYFGTVGGVEIWHTQYVLSKKNVYKPKLRSNVVWITRSMLPWSEAILDHVELLSFRVCFLCCLEIHKYE